jgi:hypothetical protein
MKENTYEFSKIILGHKFVHIMSVKVIGDDH